MASKSVYQDFDQQALQHFGLDSAPIYGVLSSSLDSVDDVVCTQDVDKYEEIKSTLHSETSFNWRACKRAFVLPKCPVSLDRIKSVAKEHNITIVNDYTKADFIISHDDFQSSFNSSELIKSTLLMYKLWNYDTVCDTVGRIPVVDKHHVPCIYDTKWSSKVNLWNLNSTSLYDVWILTGLAVNIAYGLETNTLQGVVNINNFMHSATSIQVITEDMIQLITQMVKSHSDEDLEIAGKLIPTIDRTTNHHLIWKLFQDCDEIKWKFNRNKDVQYWLDNLEFNYTNHSAEQMILKLEKKELLTKESFRFLEPICRKEIQIYNRDLYVFQVSVKPKYQEYLK